ncbi:MAG: heme exporter protein CcmB [Parvibaculaceae bacterium]|nr:heme exporter protein CcmB [Parvibaculaceae bacterium]
MIRAAFSLISRDLKLAIRLGGGGGMAVFFFLVTVAIVPLGVGPDLNLLGRIAPGMLWVSLLLSNLLTLDRLFQSDYEDGSLDFLMTSGAPLVLVAGAKAFSHWLTTGLPLVIAAPLLGLLLNLAPGAMPMLMIAMLIGTPALSFLGAIGAALTVSVRRGGLLASLLVMPFYIPVLIFGVSAASAAVTAAPGDQGPRGLMLLGALTLASLVLAPVAAAAALRANVE